MEKHESFENRRNMLHVSEEGPGRGIKRTGGVGPGAQMQGGGI